MSTLEAALRGGAVVVLLLRIVMLARNARSNQASRYSALLLTSIAAYVVESAPGFGALDRGWRLPILVVSGGTPAAFWIATSAIFIDEFRARWYHALAWLALAGLAVAGMLSHSTSIYAAQSALSLFFVLLAIWHVLAGRASDLVEERRRLRVVLVIATALYTVVIVAADWLWPGGLSAASLSLANAIGLVTLIFLAAVLASLPSTAERSAHVPAGWPPICREEYAPIGEAPAATRAGAATSFGDGLPALPSPDNPDAALIEALRKLMEHGRVYREPDLSIASLALKLDIPEYRLRRLINQQLGHRNFSAFINGYRLTEAEAALSDPAQVEVPILTIALDAGFGSIGPFNRVFKAHTGQTPTEYRRARRDRGRGSEQTSEQGVKPPSNPKLTGRL